MNSSWKFCLLAEGRVDAYLRVSPYHDWDVAAGDAIYRYSVPDGGKPRLSPLNYTGALPRKTAGFVIGRKS